MTIGPILSWRPIPFRRNLLVWPVFFACAAGAQEPALEPRAPWPPAPPLASPLEEPGELPPSVRAEPDGEGRWRCVFTWLADTPLDEASLVGEFNGWSPGATPLARGADGRARAMVVLASGVHRYKFHAGGERWLTDPANPSTEPDGHGGRNSLLRLGALGDPDSLVAVRGDGRIVAAALEHDPTRPLYVQRLAGAQVLLRYRTLASDVDAVSLAMRDAPLAAMHLASRSTAFELWEARAPLVTDPRTYTFLLRDGDLTVTDPATYELDPDGLADFEAPDWARDAVWYQLMLDRFRNGSSANDPDPVRPWTSEWNAPSDFEGADGQTFWRWFVFRRRYGGDLAGLLSKLDHLAELGVDALYLNPVFQASTYHGYDTTSFLHVDDRFGPTADYAEAEAREDLLDPATWTWTPADRLFLEFVREAHARGLKVIVDGVFNHVGTAHPAFRDVRENGRSSRFAEWFEVSSWEPFEYAGWAGYGELPAFKKSADGFHSPDVERHLLAVTRRWMDPDGDGDPADGIDGWRLDVPNEVPMAFWRRWRAHVKSIAPDAYLSGEIWERADVWLDGRHFDAVMNYPFARAALAWIGDKKRKITASECDRRLSELRLAYPEAANHVLMNLVGSHDTDRLVSMLKNPDREYDAGNREQDGAAYDGSKPGPVHYRRARLVALLQMTYLGAPMVYYGDEVGMWGADDPACRKPMLWKDLEPYEGPEENRVMEEHLAFYRKAIGLRRAHTSLRRGSIRTLLTDDERDVWVFAREADGETAVVALNASRHPAEVRIELLEASDTDGAWRSVHGEARQDSGATVHVPAIGGRVWVRTR